MLHTATLGWFLSRAIISSIARRCTSRVASFTVSSEKVVNAWAPKIPLDRPMLSPTAGASSMTTKPCRSA